MKCSMVNRYTGRRCSRPAVHMVEMGCVHEHITRGPVCSYHIVVVREQLEVTCDPCSTGPDAHECPLIGREVTGPLADDPTDNDPPEPGTNPDDPENTSEETP